MKALALHQLSKKFSIRDTESSRGLGGFFRPVYKEIHAVRPLDLEVEAGEVVAFLGPNGAGKSTTIKMLTGVLTPSGGSAEVLGLVPWKLRKKLSYRIGTVFGQKSQLWFHLPPSESFALLGSIYDMERPVFQKRRDELVDRFSLSAFFETPVRKLSLGQRMRCEIAASFLHSPEILFLDEPTIGLDVVVKREIRELLTEMNRERGTTILLTSHDIGDVEKVCRRAVIIHHGRILVDEPLSRLKRQAMEHKKISVRYTEPVDFSAWTGSPPEKVSRDGTGAKWTVDARGTHFGSFLATLGGLGQIADLNVEDAPLENIIADLFETPAEDV